MTSYFISPTGNDADSGLSGHPWKTFLLSLPKLQPSDSLTALTGTYVERVIGMTLNRGTISTPILVKAGAGQTPVIQGLLWPARADYWTFDGIHVTWDDATGQNDEQMVKFTDGVGFVYRGAELSNAKSYAALLIVHGSQANEPRDYTIGLNCIHHTRQANDVNQDHLIYVNGGTHDNNGKIIRNILYDAVNGHAVKLGGSELGLYDTAGVTVAYNTIYAIVHGVMIAWTSHDNNVYRNIIQQCYEGGTLQKAAIRGLALSGVNNTAHANAIYDAHDAVFNDDDCITGIVDGGEAFPLNPMFASTVCGGFHPNSQQAQQFGRYAPFTPN